MIKESEWCWSCWCRTHEATSHDILWGRKMVNNDKLGKINSRKLFFFLQQSLSLANVTSSPSQSLLAAFCESHMCLQTSSLRSHSLSTATVSVRIWYRSGHILDLKNMVGFEDWGRLFSIAFVDMKWVGLGCLNHVACLNIQTCVQIRKKKTSFGHSPQKDYILPSGKGNHWPLLLVVPKFSELIQRVKEEGDQGSPEPYREPRKDKISNSYLCLLSPASTVLPFCSHFGPCLLTLEFQVSTQYTPLGAQHNLNIRITESKIISSQDTNLVPTKTMSDTLPAMIKRVFRNMVEVDM